MFHPKQVASVDCAIHLKHRLRSATWVACVALSVVGLIAAPKAAQAQVLWEGTVSTDWSDGANWDGGSAPGAGDNVLIDNASPPNLPIISAINALGDAVSVGETQFSLLDITTNGSAEFGRVILGSGPVGHGRLRLAENSSLQASASSSALGEASFYVGDLGQGDLEIFNGSEVQAGGFGAFNGMIIGRQQGSGGSVEVLDAGSILTVEPRMFVGYAGHGRLTIGNGAQVLHTGGGTINQQAHIGFAGGVGEVELRGNNSLWQMAQNLAVGDGREGSGSTGMLLVEDGAELRNNFGFVGFEDDAVGTAIVRTGGLWTNSAGLEIGTVGTSQGSLTVENGGQIISTDGSLAREAGTEGEARITGAGSSWTMTADLFIGGNNSTSTGSGGTGMLTLADAGEVSAGTARIGHVDGSTARLIIGADTGDVPVAPGTLNVGSVAFGDGDGTLVLNHTATAYGLDASISGAGGTVVHVAGETVYTGTGVGFGGLTLLQGGTLFVNGSLGGDLTATGGVLGGTGAIEAATIGSAGTVAPGNPGIGTLDADSIVFSSGSFYEVELNDGGFVPGVNNDLINVANTAVINGGTVSVSTGAGSYPPGSEYTIIQAAGALNGTFDALNLVAAPALDMELHSTEDSVLLRILGDTPINDDGDDRLAVHPIPTLGFYSLVLLALLVLLLGASRLRPAG